MGSCLRSKIINLSMDIEDIYGDADILNNLLKDFVFFLINQKISCDLYITGVRLDSLLWINDFLDSSDTERHIHIGYHSNTHTFKTIPELSLQGIKRISLAEESKYDFLSGCFLKEKGGILRFQDIFQQSLCFRCPAFCWTTEYFTYMASKNMLYTTMIISQCRPFNYLSLIVLPVLEKPLEAYSNVDNLMADIEQYEAVSLYFHPARLVYDNFWDKCIRRNIYQDFQKRIDKLKTFVVELNNSFQMISIEETNNYYRTTEKRIYEAEKLLCESLVQSWQWSRLPAGFYSEDLLLSCKKSAKKTYAAERINK